MIESTTNIKRKTPTMNNSRFGQMSCHFRSLIRNIVPCGAKLHEAPLLIATRQDDWLCDSTKSLTFHDPICCESHATTNQPPTNHQPTTADKDDDNNDEDKNNCNNNDSDNNKEPKTSIKRKHHRNRRQTTTNHQPTPTDQLAKVITLRNVFLHLLMLSLLLLLLLLLP